MDNHNLCPTGSIPYVIRSGDTLQQIAKLYNANVEDIRLLNSNINPNNLSIGQQICIPLVRQLYPSCPTSNYYVVNETDTFDSIANYFDVSFQQLYNSNYGIDPNNLYKDQILCIPVNPYLVNILIDTNKSELYLIQNNRILKTYIILSNFQILRDTYIILNKQVDPGVQFGARWLGLSRVGLGIHGINTPQFIENISSDNSIILSNEDVSELFNLVSVGTQVSII